MMMIGITTVETIGAPSAPLNHTPRLNHPVRRQCRLKSHHRHQPNLAHRHYNRLRSHHRHQLNLAHHRQYHLKYHPHHPLSLALPHRNRPIFHPLYLHQNHHISHLIIQVLFQAWNHLKYYQMHHHCIGVPSQCCIHRDHQVFAVDGIVDCAHVCAVVATK